MSTPQELPEIKLDQDNLYREDTFSDRRAGAVRRLTPVTADGENDPGRKVVFEGQTSLMTGAGSLPINFELEVGSLKEALEKFPEAAQKEVERTLEELRELQRQSSSSIVTPGSGGMGGMGGQGGSGIQFR
jgi:hypothetical protein